MKVATHIAWLGAALVAAGCGKAPCDPPYSCPTAPDGGAAVVNCMPPNGGAPECSGQCYAWIAESCPDVVFVY